MQQVQAVGKEDDNRQSLRKLSVVAERESELVPDSSNQLPWRRQVAVFVLYLGLAVAYTYPLAFQLSNHIPDKHPTANLTSDAALPSWYPWWVQKALLNPEESILHSDWVFYPVGMEMTMQPAMFLHGAMTIPLWWLDITTANNIVILISFALSGLAACLLGFYLFRSLPAALFCGFVYAFCPFKFLHLEGHYQLMATETLPLVALSLVRLYDTPSRRHLLWAGCWLGVTIYTDYYYFAYSLLLFAAIAAYQLVTRGERLRTLQHTLVVGLLALVITSPLLVPALQSASRSDYAVATGHEEHKADLLSFFIPGERQWVGQPLQPWVGDLLNMEAVDGIEHSLYVGWGLLILCGFYARQIFRSGGHARLFVFIAGGFLVLTLGPELGLNGVKEIGGWSLPLPGALLAELPVFKGARAPSRIYIVAVIGLAVWAGYALQMLLNAISVRGIRSSTVAGLVVAVTAIEYITPVNLSAFERAPWLDIVRNDPAPGTIVHMPLRPFLAAFHQPRTDRKVMRVILGRTDPEVALYYWRNDALRFFTFPQYIAAEPRPLAAGYAIDLLHVRYVSLDRMILEPRLEYICSILESAYGMKRVYEDNSTVLYRYPHRFRVFEGMNFTVKHETSEMQLIYGWSNRRKLGDETITWMTLPRPILALPPMAVDDYVLNLDVMVLSTEAVEVAVEIEGEGLGTYTLNPGRNRMAVPIERGQLRDTELNLVRMFTDRSVGLPHRAGMSTDPSPYNVPIEVTSEGHFTRNHGVARIQIGSQAHATRSPGILAVTVDSTGHTETRLFEHVTEGVTIDSLEKFILSAPVSATTAIAICRSGMIYGGSLMQALRWLGLPPGTKLNRLNSLAIIGSRDGRPPVIDTGAAVAEIVLGPIEATADASIGLIGAQLTAR